MRLSFSYRYTGTAALLAGALMAGGLTERRIPEVLAAPLASIATEIDGWVAAGDHKLPDGPAHALNATAYLARTYEKAGRRMEVFVAYYAQQRAGESMHSPKHCLPGAGWEIWKLGSADVPVDGAPVRVNRYSIENGDNREVMFYWYQSKTRIVASEYIGKLLLARDTLITGRTGGSIVRLMTPDTPGATAEGVAFARKLIPEMKRCLVGVDGRTSP